MPRLLHASGRFDETPAWLRRDLKRWRELAGIITVTEVADKDRKQALFAPGWTATAGKGEGAGECAILTRDLLWRRVDRFTVPITEGRGFGRLKAPIYATTAVVQRRGTGRLLIVSTAHMPAHVETLLRVGRKLPPASTWKQAARRWARHITQVRRQYPDAEVWCAADWNVNANSSFMRNMLRDEFSAAGKDLRVAASTKGTHHTRVIDFALTTLIPETARVHHAEASDHQAVRFVARWPVRRKR